MKAGPTCPVVQDPPDPNCTDRAVGNELVVVSRADGTVVESRRTDPEGRTSFTLPAGSYSVLPGNESGYMGAPGPSVVIIRSGAVSRVDFSYDTGIR